MFLPVGQWPPRSSCTVGAGPHRTSSCSFVSRPRMPVRPPRLASAVSVQGFRRVAFSACPGAQKAEVRKEALEATWLFTVLQTTSGAPETPLPSCGGVSSGGPRACAGGPPDQMDLPCPVPCEATSSGSLVIAQPAHQPLCRAAAHRPAAFLKVRGAP